MQRRTLALFALGAVLFTTDAQAFCRKTTCKKCQSADGGACVTEGQPLYWPGACVSYALTRAASIQVDEQTASVVAERAFDAWRNVTCPGDMPPSITAKQAFGATSCSQADFSYTGANANIIAFRDTDWSSEDSEDSLGATSLSFDPGTGEILDADIEINSTPAIKLWSAPDDAIPDDTWYDLQSILTHEAGHFLGLGHSSDPDSIMWPTYKPGTASLRVPSSDDIEGICAIYPPLRSARPCNFTPERGFANECPLAVFRGGCAVTSARASDSGWVWVALILGVALERRRVGGRRRPGSPRRNFLA